MSVCRFFQQPLHEFQCVGQISLGPKNNQFDGDLDLGFLPSDSYFSISHT